MRHRGKAQPAAIWAACVGALAFWGCGTRVLELDVTIGTRCAVAIPAGGSLLYEVITTIGDAGSPQVCGGCIAVPSALSNGPALVELLRAAAPRCPVTRASQLRMRLTSFAGPGCVPGGPVAGTPLCAATAPLIVDDGRADQRLELELTCEQSCNMGGCVSVGCTAQGKDCDTISDGCGNTLQCGECKPPQKCGGGGVPNVCGR